MNKPHKHAEVIKAAADGKDVQRRGSNDTEWGTYSGEYALAYFSWTETDQYRIKPERKYPETRMAGNELRAAYNANLGGPVVDALTRVANAVIRRAIEDGDVVLPKEKA